MFREQAVEGQDTFACRFTYALYPDRLAPGHILKCNTHTHQLPVRHVASSLADHAHISKRRKI